MKTLKTLKFVKYDKNYRTRKRFDIYRVAQNKIPHQTICNIFATSGQILKILEAV